MSSQHSTPLRSRTQEITAEYWEVRDEQSERVAVAQLILQFALLEEQLHAVENTPTLNALNEVARLKEQLETTRIELSRTIRLLSNEVDRAEGLEEQNETLRDALDTILTRVEDANQPYERLGIGAVARAALYPAKRPT